MGGSGLVGAPHADPAVPAGAATGATPSGWRARFGRTGARWAPWALAAIGTIAAVAAAGGAPASARSAASQDWPPFVLVAGLLLVGVVVDDDGLFAAAGRKLAGAAPGDARFLAGVTVLAVAVTAVLNLDTSVAFLTPVVVHAVRRRSGPHAVPVAACLLLSNAGSLLLPGANLTNLIVLGRDHLSGGGFLARSAPACVAGVVVTAAVVAAARWHEGRAVPAPPDPPVRPAPADPPAMPGGEPAARPHLGLGLAAAAAVAVLVVTLRDAALPVLGIGLVAVGIRLVQRRLGGRRVAAVVGPNVLVGLLGLAIALGTLGRAWDGPAHLLAHLDRLGSAALGAGTSVVANNLPAASLLGAGRVAHPVSLLVGLDIGPNLFVTGSLSWVLWLRAARHAGDQPSLATATRLGLWSAPLAMLAAVAVLVLLN